MNDSSNAILSFLPLIAIIAIIVPVVMLIKNRKIAHVSCPKCGNLCEQGKYKTWQILVAVFAFPCGLLALLADKNPTQCINCGFIWQS